MSAIFRITVEAPRGFTLTAECDAGVDVLPAVGRLMEVLRTLNGYENRPAAAKPARHRAKDR